ncbi:MAG: GNAT family N-acetyltransferase [Candidatus Rokubacteria bacterium]|nr:GNAT family N-acetyltransferase [Candidatus Rokubacteria bacterium]
MTPPRDAEEFLRGEGVTLRAVVPADVPLLARWASDEEVTFFMFTGQRPLTEAQVAEDVQRAVANPANTVFTVVDRQSGHAIGTAGLYDAHPTARKAEFRVLLGDRRSWNRGYGTEVTELLTFYGFDRLNLNKVWLGVIAENAGAHRAYVKAGFREEGRLREELYRNSRYYDAIRMSVLRSEYYPDLHRRHARRFQAAPAPPRPAR